MPVLVRGTDAAGDQFIELTKTLNIKRNWSMHHFGSHSSTGSMRPIDNLRPVFGRFKPRS
jgi:hypothetical protein